MGRIAALAAAAALVVGLFVHHSVRPRDSAVAQQVLPPALPAPCEQRTLPDGSHVELNRGARLQAAFTATERRVRLENGEASFMVAKDPSRPFVVEGEGVEARAVGTVFHVRLAAGLAEVLVTEGVVRVASPHSAAVALAAKQRVVVARNSSAPVRVETVSDAEIARTLAWQPQMLDFDDTPLSAVVADFNRHNPIRLVITDAAIAGLRMNGLFRSDNVAGFARLLAKNYGIRFERGASPEIVVLRR
jgi:transmembrane sensor